MKNVFLVMVVSALLVTLGFAQTPPAAGSTPEQTSVNGCLAGTEGSYTVAESGTSLILKITTSSVDLKPHVGHDVKLIGHKASGTVSSGAADNSFAVTELTMISEHCAGAPATAAAAPAVTVTPPSETLTPPAVDAATVSPTSATVSAPAGPPAAPLATASAPVVDAAVPTTTVSPASATVVTPPVEAAAPVAVAAPVVTVTPPAPMVSAPAAKAVQPTRPSAPPRKASATPAPAATEPAVVSPSADTVSTPAANVPAPAPTHRGALWLMVLVVVLVIVLGTMVPLYGRWRKRKTLERTSTQNLSFTNEAPSDRDKPEPRKAA